MSFEKIFQVAEQSANVILWLLVLLSVLSLAMIFERLMALRKVNQASQKLGPQLREIIAENNLSELETLSKNRDSLEGRALSYGLRHVHAHGDKGLEPLLTSYALMEKPFLDRNLNVLATIGSNAPYVGLLGTVLGIMKSFDDLANAGGKNEAVLTGIAHALTATAIGLVVAIPAVIAYNLFSKQVKSTMTNLEAVKDLCLAYARAKGKSNGI